MNRTDQQFIQKIAEKIGREFEPEKIILFGSYAWGKPSEDSDVDLFVIKEADDILKLEREIDSSIFPRKFAVDILVYTPGQVKKRQELGDFFVKDIINNGRILYERAI